MCVLYGAPEVMFYTRIAGSTTTKKSKIDCLVFGSVLLLRSVRQMSAERVESTKRLDRFCFCRAAYTHNHNIDRSTARCLVVFIFVF